MKRILFILFYAALIFAPSSAQAFTGEKLNINYSDKSNAQIVNLLICDNDASTNNIVTTDETCTWVKDNTIIGGFAHLELLRNRIGSCRISLNGQCLESWPPARYRQRYQIPDLLRIYIEDLKTEQTYLSESIVPKYVNEWLEINIIEDEIQFSQQDARLQGKTFYSDWLVLGLFLVYKLIPYVNQC